MRKQLRGEELERRAGALGVDTQGAPITQSISGKARRCDDHELQKRVLEAERSIREQRLWLVAVISAVASVVSAITALVAVLANQQIG